MSMTEQLTQQLSLADVINSAAITNASTSSLGIDMGKCKRLTYIVIATNVGAAGTLDGRLQSAANSNFNAGVHNISGTNFAQILTNNVLSTVEVRSDEVVNANSADRYVRLNLTGGGNAVTCQAIGIAAEGVQEPLNTQLDLSSSYIQQRVVCNI